MARRIGIRDLRQHASTYIRRAGAGERILVTVSGQPTAILCPVDAPVSGQPAMTDLIASGAVLAARRTGAFKFGDPIVVHSGARIDQLLRQVRG
ncbi:MAG: type II toxin-antitoxin system prevent-host-death family antitoxin [Ilumatobacteraceae bacterium]